jgi:aminoglycoside 6'-N-acetyltransferase
MPANPSYTFRPAAKSDLPLLEDWLQAPEVVAWWGDPLEQAELLRADLDEPRMQMELVLYQGAALCLCEPAMIGRGHGSAYLKIIALRLQAAGVPRALVSS